MDTSYDETAALLLRAQQGERLALSALLTRCRPFLLGLAQRALGNHDDAQDVAQNVLIYLTQRLHEIRDAKALPAWLRQVTLHQCADFRRRRATRHHPGASWDTANIAVEETDIAQRLAIEGALAQLPETQRLPLVLEYLGGYSHQEIADLLQIPLPTLRSRLQAGKRQLRKTLQ